MAVNYTFLNEISASGGYYALDTIAPAISILYNTPSSKISNSKIQVAVNVYEVGGMASSGIYIEGAVTPISAFTKTGDNYTFVFNVTATSNILISATDIAGNSSSLTVNDYIISAISTDTIPPVITFYNQTPENKNVSSESIGSLRVRVTDNQSIAANPNNFILTDESIGTIDYLSLSAINAKTVEFDIINIVNSGYVTLSAVDDAGNGTIATDGQWVSVCADGKKINITNFLPAHLRESEMFDLMQFFEDFLNSMYYDKTKQCNISILEKINKLKELKDINELDAEYFQFFADHFGYEIDINKNSIGLFSTTEDESEIDEYIRLSLKNMPNFNRLKSSEDAISIMLFSFGVIADIIYLWTNDYDKNWSGESRYNLINVKNEIPDSSVSYYPTPHFRISVNYTQTAPSWVENFNKIVDAVNNIRPLNTVFKEFNGYFEPVYQDPKTDELAFGYFTAVKVRGSMFIEWDQKIWTYTEAPFQNSWTLVDTAQSDEFYSVFKTSTNKLIAGLAVGSFVSTSVMVSDDNAETWTQYTTTATSGGIRGFAETTTGRIISIRPSNSTYDAISVSDDGGVTWTAKTNPVLGNWNKVIKSTTGRLIAISYSDTTNNVMVSDDNGETWTIKTTPAQTSIGLYDIIQTNTNRLVAVGSITPSAVLVSDDDGETWTAKTTSFAVSAKAVIQTNTGRLIAVFYYGSANQVMVSDDDGETWTTKTTNIYNRWEDLIQMTDGTIFAVGSYYTVLNAYGMTSTDDGETWLSNSAVPVQGYNIVQTDSKRLVVVSQITTDVAYGD